MRDRFANESARSLTFLALCIPLACHVIPLAVLLADGIFVDGRFTLSVFVDVLSENHPWRVLLTTLHVAAWGASLATCIGSLSAWGIGSLPRSARAVLEPWIVLPLALPPYLVTLAWIYACGPNGLVSGWFPGAGLLLDGPWSAGTLLAACFVPIPHVVVRMALRNVDRTARDAGRLALGERRTVLRVTWPAIRGATSTAWLVCFLLMATTFDVPALLQVETQGNAILATFHHTYDARRATALALPLLGIAMVLVMVLVRRTRRATLTWREERSGETREARRPRANLVVACLALLAVILGVFPIATLMSMAGGFDAIDSMLRTAGTNLRLGLEVALVAAAIGTATAFLLAEASCNARRRYARLVDGLVLCALALPPTLLGIASIQVYSRDQAVLRYLFETPWILVITAMGRFLPFAFLIVREALDRLGPRATESARLAGLNTPAVWVYVHLRAIAGSLCAAFFLLFALTLTELPTAQLVAPPGRTTLPIRLFTIMHYGQDRLVSAMGLALIAFAGSCFLLVKLGLLSRSAR